MNGLVEWILMVLTRSQSQKRSSAISFFPLLGRRCSTRWTAAVETSVFIGFILIFSCCRRLSGEKEVQHQGKKGTRVDCPERGRSIWKLSNDWNWRAGAGGLGGAVSRGKKQSSTRRRRHSIADRSNDNTVASSALGAGQKKRRTKRARANQIK